MRTQQQAASGKKTKTTRSTPSRSLKSNEDIIGLILEDHKPLKKLIKILKSETATFSSRKAAFIQFAPLLLGHAKPEESVLYTKMKEDKDLRQEGCEGEVEHALADQMVKEVQAASDEDVWSAKAKVLAELVEHHIEEEEDEILPDFKKYSKLDERLELGQAYLEAKTAYEIAMPLPEPQTKSRSQSGKKALFN